MLAINQKRSELILDDGCCGGRELDFRLCWRTNSKQQQQQEVVVVARDGRTMYPDVNDNNSSEGPGGLLISWPEHKCSSCSSRSSSQPAALVNISLLAPEDGKPDIARYEKVVNNKYYSFILRYFI